MVRRLRDRLLAALVFLALAWNGAGAQCAMCGSAAPYAGARPGHVYAGLAAGALVLLVPVLVLLGALAFWVWRQRGAPGPSEADGRGGAARTRVLS